MGTSLHWMLITRMPPLEGVSVVRVRFIHTCRID